MKKVPLGVLLVAGLSVSVLSKAKEPQPTYLVDIPNPAVCYDNEARIVWILKNLFRLLYPATIKPQL